VNAATAAAPMRTRALTGTALVGCFPA
jgi:hypothetical protein